MALLKPSCVTLVACLANSASAFDQAQEGGVGQILWVREPWSVSVSNTLGRCSSNRVRDSEDKEQVTLSWNTESPRTFGNYTRV